MNENPEHNPELFGNEPLPVDIPPVDGAWADMKTRLDEKDRRRPFAWWWFTGFELLVLSMVTWYLIANNDQHQQHGVQKREVIGRKPHTDQAGAALDTEKGDRMNEDLQTPAVDSAVKDDGLLTEKTSSPTLKKTSTSFSVNHDAIAVTGAGPRNDVIKYTEKQSSDITIVASNDTAALQRIAPVASVAKEANGQQKRLAEDSSGISNADSSDEEEKAVVQAGLQWNAQLHFSNLPHYFDGPDGSSQPWRVLLPGVFVSWQHERFMLTAEAMPFAGSVLANKPYSEKTLTYPGAVVTEKKSLQKVFGVSVGLLADYQLSGNWYAGGGINASYWVKGTAILDSMFTPTSAPAFSSQKDFALSETDWKAFKRFQMGLDAELLYKSKRWQAGARGRLMFAPLINKAGQKNLLFGELYFRLPLYPLPGKK
jgi:hypothetical protein